MHLKRYCRRCGSGYFSDPAAPDAPSLCPACVGAPSDAVPSSAEPKRRKRRRKT
jgi:hypothetical protein